MLPQGISQLVGLLLSPIFFVHYGGVAPLGHDRACHINYSQTPLFGIFAGIQPYLREMASLKALMWRMKPSTSIGNAVKLEGPFSIARPMASWSKGRREFLKP